MGPSNVALLKLFRAEQSLREATSRLNAVTKDLRLQETRRNQTGTKLQAAQTRQKELQSKSANFDLDLKMREEHIEKLRGRQQLAANNKEYQALLVEINTAKVDRAKVEEQAIKLLEQLESTATEVKNLTTALESDEAKLAQMKAEVGDKAAAAQAEVDRIKPERDAAAAPIKPQILQEFNRLADRYEGEAMAAIDKPNPREEEYLCTGCMMSLVADVFNKLKTRDDVVACPSCRRMLFIAEGATFETTTAKKTTTRSKSTAKSTDKKVIKTDFEPKAPESKWAAIVTAAQGESVRDAVEADNNPVECVVSVNGELVGQFKGKSPEHLERVIRFRLEEAKMSADVKVTLTGAEAAAVTSATP